MANFIDSYNFNKHLIKDIENQLVYEWNNGLSHPDKIGKLDQLWRSYCKPTDHIEFFNRYAEDFGLEELIDSTIQLSQRTNINLQLCEAWVYDRIFIKNTIGAYMESQAIKMLNSWGYFACGTDYEVDTTDGLDILVYQNGRLTYGIQVKPLSFFLGYKPITHWKQKEMEEKLTNSEIKYNIQCYLFVYDSRTLQWVNYGNNPFYPFREHKKLKTYKYTNAYTKPSQTT